MAVNNRTEAISKVDTTITTGGELTALEHRNLLDNELLNSLMFRKDVITTLPSTSGSQVIDFANSDRVDITITGNTVFSFSNVEVGDVKVLNVSKSSGHEISFSGALDSSNSPEFINTMSFITYVVSSRGFIYVEGLTKNLFEASDLEVLSGEPYKYLTPAKLQHSESWITPTLTNANISQSAYPLRYRKESNGSVRISGNVNIDVDTGTSSFVLFTLPASHQVSIDGFFDTGISLNGKKFSVRYDDSPLGEIRLNPLGTDSFLAGDLLYINIYIPKDD